MLADSTALKIYTTQSQSGPRAVYGAGAHLVPAYTSDVGIGIARQNTASFDARFAMPLLLLVILATFMLLFRRNLARFAISVFNLRKFLYFRNSPLWSTWPFFIFIFIFSIPVLALLLSEATMMLSPILAEGAFSTLFLSFCGVAAGTLLFRLFSCYIIGYVSNMKKLFFNIALSQILYFAVLAILILTVLFIKIFLDESFSTPMLLLVVAAAVSVFMMYAVRSFRLFYNEHGLIFFWILYLCTIEILPMLLTYKILENTQ